MIHAKRTYRITDAASPEALATDLVEHSHTLCTGFRLGDLLVLNDAFGEDGAQEYAVVRGGRQIESLTVSWMATERLAAILARLAEGGGTEDLGAVDPRTDHPTGPCRLCA